MESNELLQSLKKDILDLKNSLLTCVPGREVSNKWIPRRHVMEFMGYGNTQMASFEKEAGLVTSKIGKRKFYHRDSIEKLLEKNIINLNK